MVVLGQATAAWNVRPDVACRPVRGAESYRTPALWRADRRAPWITWFVAAALEATR